MTAQRRMRLSLGSAPTGTRWQESLAASVRHHLSKVLGRGEQTEAIVAECVAIAAAAAAPPTATFGIAAEFGSHGSTLVLLFILEWARVNEPGVGRGPAAGVRDSDCSRGVVR